MLPTPVFGLREFHGLYSPWGHKESVTTEWLSLTHSLSHTTAVEPSLLSVCQQEETFWYESILISQALVLFWT